jgi:hypothetical protein
MSRWLRWNYADTIVLDWSISELAEPKQASCIQQDTGDTRFAWTHRWTQKREPVSLGIIRFPYTKIPYSGSFGLLVGTSGSTCPTNPNFKASSKQSGKLAPDHRELHRIGIDGQFGQRDRSEIRHFQDVSDNAVRDPSSDFRNQRTGRSFRFSVKYLLGRIEIESHLTQVADDPKFHKPRPAEVDDGLGFPFPVVN